MTDWASLQAFLYRGTTTNARVSVLIEEGMLAEPPIPGSADASSVLDEFDMDARIKAKRMGRIYELLYCLEDSMRRGDRAHAQGSGGPK